MKNKPYYTIKLPVLESFVHLHCGPSARAISPEGRGKAHDTTVEWMLECVCDLHSKNPEFIHKYMNKAY